MPPHACRSSAAPFNSALCDHARPVRSDLDMVIGNLPLFLEHRELATQDIISYSFGDMDALYLRGQWTVHRNRREVSTIWKVRALARLCGGVRVRTRA